jgi:hypothetical protein
MVGLGIDIDSTTQESLFYTTVIYVLLCFLICVGECVIHVLFEL